MFFQIFLFELRYRLGRPVVYGYFFLVLLVSTLLFAAGHNGESPQEYINSPAMLALLAASMSLFLMLVSSTIMGVPLYRDIEYHTKEYYLSYPITEAGYFWGRYLGSFFLVLMISLAVFLGAWLGSLLGPVLGWNEASRYAPARFWWYAQPFLTILLPTLFCLSSLFFGLMAVLRNVKVIYSSGIFLLLAYLLANFFFNTTSNEQVIYLGDPFLLNGLRRELAKYSPEQKNAAVIGIRGLILANRILWTSLGALILLLTWWRFSFQRFFSGSSRQTPVPADLPGKTTAPATETGLRPLAIKFDSQYTRQTLASLTRLEIRNILRDNFFWIIMSGGVIFLSTVFWHVRVPGNVRDFPMGAFFLNIFNGPFLFFLFLVIIFYAGEAIHRERSTRFALLSDTFPAPTPLLNGAKLLALCCLAAGLSLIPLLIGPVIQLLRGNTQFQIPLYLSSTLMLTLPRLIEMVLLAWTIHLIVPNKFAAHGAGITLWLLLIIVQLKGYLNYKLLLYSYGPMTFLLDTGGIGHMLRPVAWFHLYWLLAGGTLVLLASLFYPRGLASSFRGRMRLAATRWQGSLRILTLLFISCFLAVGGYIYYQVSYLNEYLTAGERIARNEETGKALKQYAGLPLPKLTRMTIFTDLYPDKQGARSRALITIRNAGQQPIDSLLLNGEELTSWSVYSHGQPITGYSPLSFTRGKFNCFRPALEPSPYRVYKLPAALQPGDTALLELRSEIRPMGFRNEPYGMNLVRSKTLLSNAGLPEIRCEGEPQEEGSGNATRQNDPPADPVQLDITVSTLPGQRVTAPGVSVRNWKEGDRQYFHYVLNAGIPFSITANAMTTNH